MSSAGLCSLELNDSAAQTNRYGLRAIACPKFLNDMFDVDLYGRFTDEEFFRNVAIPVSPGNMA